MNYECNDNINTNFEFKDAVNRGWELGFEWKCIISCSEKQMGSVFAWDGRQEGCVLQYYQWCYGKRD